MWKFLIALGPILLSGCAKVNIDRASMPTLTEGRSVDIGKDSSASVGSIMYSEYSYYASKIAVTRAAFSTSILFSKIAIPAGSQLLQAAVDGALAYCTIRPAYFAVGESRSVCLFDTRGAGIFDQFYIVDTLSTIRYDASVPYRVEEASSDSGGYKNELLYQGIAGDVIKISYREYTNNLARPAFQQDLSYTLHRISPTEISFRGANIVVADADNNRIRYRVMSGFSSH